MPRPCSAGLVEDGQRTTSERQRPLQNCQVSLLRKPDASVDIFVRATFCLLLISVSNDEWSPFQLQIMPPTVTSHGDTEKECGGSLSNQNNPQAFPKEAWQLFGGRMQPEAQVPHRADWYRSHFGERNLPSKSFH